MSTDRRLAGSIGRAALPWGYTAVTWTSGGVLIHRHGPPDLLSAYLFLGGAVLGLVAVALVARGDAPETGPLTELLASALGAGLGLAAAGALAEAVHTRIAYLLAATGSTTVYYLARAAVIRWF